MTTIALIILAVFALVLVALIVKDVVKAKRTNVKYHFKQCIAGYLMMAPAVVLAFIFVMLPILFSLGYAFTDYHMY